MAMQDQALDQTLDDILWYAQRLKAIAGFLRQVQAGTQEAQALQGAYDNIYRAMILDLKPKENAMLGSEKFGEPSLDPPEPKHVPPTDEEIEALIHGVCHYLLNQGGPETRRRYGRAVSDAVVDFFAENITDCLAKVPRGEGVKEVAAEYLAGIH